MTITMLLSRLLEVTQEPPAIEPDAEEVLQTIARVSEERQPLVEELKRSIQEQQKLTTSERSMLQELQLRDQRWSVLLQKIRGALSERIRNAG